ncbi:AAA family ATPase [Burkholderia pseudomallei]|uniref:AAA family ATPase n=1 Tax=Burkholderia pseudomallei TaxID=28450 RepID=UPI0022EA474A|nr:ATP-binding protein [Burkholderia pseudomallei]
MKQAIKEFAAFVWGFGILRVAVSGGLFALALLAELFSFFSPAHGPSFGQSFQLIILAPIALWALLTWRPGDGRLIEVACALAALTGTLLVIGFVGTTSVVIGIVFFAWAGWYLHKQIGFHNVGECWSMPGGGYEGALDGDGPDADRSTAGRTQAEADNPFLDRERKAGHDFSAIVGMTDLKKRLLRAGESIRDADGKSTPRNGILLFGPPGNGKTFFAEALAGELGLPFLSIAWGDVASKWLNEPAERVKAVFDAAKRLGHGVLFIDEIDSFLQSRAGDDTGGGKAQADNLTNVMLTEINALRQTRIVLVAATNHRDKLDSAGIREKRFDFQIEVTPPDRAARVELLRRGVLKAYGSDAATPGAIESLAERWAGFSVARLTSIGEQLAEMLRDGQLDHDCLLTVDDGMQAMRLLQGRRGNLPETVKSIDEIIMPEQSREAITDLAFRMERVADLERVGGSIPAGLIFYGPPGTGKTQAAMALAKASGYAFLSITGTDIMSNPAAWDKLIAEATDIRPCIVFIDEADDILRDRRQSHVATLTNKILTTLDGGTGKVRDLVYIAATNHYDQLDAAVTRGGRFEAKVAFDVPSREDMSLYVYKSLRRHTDAGYAIAETVSASLIDQLDGLSIANADAVIKAAVNSAALRHLRGAAMEITEADVDQAMDAIRGADQTSAGEFA